MTDFRNDEKHLAKIHNMKNFSNSPEFDAIGRLKNNMSNNAAYRKAYDLFLRISALIERMDRTMEKAMVSRLSNACVDMLITLYKMDMSASKTKYLSEAYEKIEVVEMLLRLIKEFKLIAVFYISDLEDHIKQLSQQMYAECGVAAL
jgi:hypothetical protein